MSVKRWKPVKDANQEDGNDRHSNGVSTKQSHLQRKWREEYYEQQSRLLRVYEEDKELCEFNVKFANDDQEDHQLLHASLFLTIFSLIGNLVASILSGSISILRLEYVGILICAILMAFANVAMALQAFNNIADKSSKPELTLLTIVIVKIQTVLKGLLSWVCYRRGSPSSIIIAMDLRNDVITRLSAVIFAYIGDEYWRLADPIGAIILCTLIAISWSRHALEHITHLVGKSAKREQLSRILKIAIDHDARIRCLDHVMVYHTGPKAFVELHIVMDEKLTLKKKLQHMEFVERAFVHCDYFCDGD